MSKERVLGCQQVREFDRIAIEEFKIPSLVLMENAARAATDVLCQQQPEAGSVMILCGPGNNGGDGLVMARHLHLRGWQVNVILLAKMEKLSQDSAVNLRILEKTNVEIVKDFDACMASRRLDSMSVDWVIDAMLGTGGRPPLRAPFDAWTNWANELTCRRLAIDIPSGLDGATGTTEGPAFQADLTITFVAMKPGLLTDTGKTCCGETRIVDIGAPPEVFSFLEETD